MALLRITFLQAIYISIGDAVTHTWTLSFTEMTYKMAELISLADKAGIDCGWSSRTMSDSTRPGEMACRAIYF